MKTLLNHHQCWKKAECIHVSIQCCTRMGSAAEYVKIALAGVHVVSAIVSKDFSMGIGA